MNKLYSIILVVFFTISCSTHGFSKSNLEFKFDSIKNAIDQKNYQKALEGLVLIEKEKTENAHIQYLIGLCYYNLNQEKEKGIPYFSKACQKINKDYKFIESETSASPLALYFLAKCYHSDLQFDKAIDMYTKYKMYISSKDKITLPEIEQNIAMCSSGKELINTPLANIDLLNITKEMNSDAAEVLLYLSPNKEWFLYSTTLPKESYSSNTGISNGLYQCYLNKNNNHWENPIKIDASSSSTDISNAENITPFFYSQMDKRTLNIYYSFCTGSKVTGSIKMDLPVNNEKSSQMGACISIDGTTLFFSSNREGGYGGYDIYKCTKMSSGKWGTPQNLGPQVNTSSDEISPFVLTDGVTLYFSSKGHNSIGGYDIFVSTQSEEGFWGKAENIGYPISSPDDDIYYFLSSDEKNAFFSSSRNGTVGGGDLFQVDFK